MTCDTIQNRLLAEANPAKPAADLREHVAACKPCQRFVESYVAMAKDIKALAVPSSELAKMTFTESLTSAGPIIQRRPATNAGFSFVAMLRVAAKPLAVTAAAVAVGFGLWAVSGSRPNTETPVARHELLKKVIGSNTTLATMKDPNARLTVLTAMAGDLRGETLDVLHAAPADDLNSLAGMYETVVTVGLVTQAKQLDGQAPAVRQNAIGGVVETLTRTKDEMNNLALTAPPQAKVALKRMADAAENGRSKLERIARGEGV